MLSRAEREELFREVETNHGRFLVIAQRIARRNPGSKSRGVPSSPEPKDLLYAAVAQTCGGGRNRPPGMDWELFLGQVMRSIAFAERGKARRRRPKEQPYVRERAPQDEELDDEPEDSSLDLAELPTYLDQRHAQDVLDQVIALLDADPVANQVAQAAMTGALRPADIAAVAGIDPAAVYLAKDRMVPKLQPLADLWLSGESDDDE